MKHKIQVTGIDGVKRVLEMSKVDIELFYQPGEYQYEYLEEEKEEEEHNNSSLTENDQPVGTDVSLTIDKQYEKVDILVSSEDNKNNDTNTITELHPNNKTQIINITHIKTPTMTLESLIEKFLLQEQKVDNLLTENGILKQHVCELEMQMINVNMVLEK